MPPLTPDEFRDALHKGLGRALMHVQQYGTAGLKEIILDACIHNYAYDAQVEGSRADWMLRFIEADDDRAFFLKGIITALEQSEFWDTIQILDLLVFLAKEGSIEARDALYREFDRQRHIESWAGGKQIIELDGISGMLYVAEVIGARIVQESEYWEDDWLVTVAGRKHGQARVIAALKERAMTNPNIQAYLDSIEKQQKGQRSGVAPYTIDSLLETIEKGQVVHYLFMKFGQRATATELEEVYTSLLAEHRPEQLLGYLSVFRKRAVPFIAPRLFEFAESEDEQIRNAALELLSNVQHSDVRALALRIIHSNDAELLPEAITMLAPNYESGDAAIILNAAKQLSDPDLLHAAGFAILDIAKLNQPPEMQSLLLWLYENTPCSNCHHKGIELLIERGSASKELLEECRWDCSHEIQELAEKSNPPDTDDRQ